jgi:hypothetical protein
MFRPFSGWIIIRLGLEYRRKLIYYNVDITNGGPRSRFTMFVEVCSYIYAIWDLRWLRVTHLISTSTESHNADDATKDLHFTATCRGNTVQYRDQDGRKIEL